MNKDALKDVDGQKIRQQYFTLPVLMFYALMVFIPYCILIFSIQLGKFVLSEWLESLWMSLWICFVFSIPWVILKIFNRRCFGKIICVLTEEGIHYAEGFISWESISKIEYVIVLPSKYKYNPDQKCRALVYTPKECIVLLHAPSHILRCIKKIHPQTNTKISTGSKWLVTSITLLLLVLVPLIPFFASAA